MSCDRVITLSDYPPRDAMYSAESGRALGLTKSSSNVLESDFGAGLEFDGIQGLQAITILRENKRGTLVSMRNVMKKKFLTKTEILEPPYH